MVRSKKISIILKQSYWLLLLWAVIGIIVPSAAGEYYDIKLNFTEISTTDGCNGNIGFAPTETYPLNIILRDQSLGILKTIRLNNSEYLQNDTIEIIGINIETGITNIRTEIDWDRIIDPDSRYDHGGTVNAEHTDKCNANTQPPGPLALSINHNSTCGVSLGTTGFPATVMSVFSDASCTTLIGNITFDYNSWPSLFVSGSYTCRAYESYSYSGGTDANYIGAGCTTGASTQLPGGGGLVGIVKLIMVKGLDILFFIVVVQMEHLIFVILRTYVQMLIHQILYLTK